MVIERDSGVDRAQFDAFLFGRPDQDDAQALAVCPFQQVDGKVAARNHFFDLYTEALQQWLQDSAVAQAQASLGVSLTQCRVILQLR